MSPLPVRRAALVVATAAALGLSAALPAGAAAVPSHSQPGEPLRITNVHPPTPVANRELELTIYGQGFSDDAENIKVSVVGRDVTVFARSVQVQSPRRLRVTVPAGTRVGTASVSVQNPGDGAATTLRNALYFRPAGERFSWKTTLYQMGYDWRGFVEWFKLGGPLMYVLAALSFFGAAWAVHCLLVLRRSQILPQKFLEALNSHLDQADIDGAIVTCRRSRCMFSRVILGGLRRVHEPAEKVRDAITASGSREAAHLHQKISYLANIGTISPMLGLLGTVLGMIMAFNIISSGEVRHYLLAAAIARAMVTTAAGLVIGIPAMALYFYLRGRLLRLTTHVEVIADSTAQVIIQKGTEG